MQPNKPKLAKSRYEFLVEPRYGARDRGNFPTPRSVYNKGEKSGNKRKG